MIRSPLLVVGPPGTPASLVAAMLGRHAEAQDFPELNLQMAPNMGAVLQLAELSDGQIAHGLLRTIAHCFCGGQTDAGIASARLWLQRRADWTGAQFLDYLAQGLAPNLVIVADTSIGWRPGYIDRLLDDMPDARVLHVLSHPRVYGRETAMDLQGRLYVAPDFKDFAVDPPVVDPQVAWARFHRNIERALSGQPVQQYRQLHAERLFAAPETTLASLAQWLGLSTEPFEIEAMQHPEEGVFSCFGPLAAPRGADETFLASPYFMRRLTTIEPLEGPLEWREDGSGFAPEVIAIAQDFGYR